MSLIKCHECGHQVSSTAKTCPSCGAKVKKGLGCGALMLAVIVTFVVLIGFSAVGISSKTSPSASPSPQPDQVDEDKKARERLKETFDAKIADFYQRLLSLKQAGDVAGAMAVVRQFEKFRRSDYRDVAAISKELKTTSAMARLSKTPEGDIKSLSGIYAELATLHPENAEYLEKSKKFAADWKLLEDARLEQERKEANEKAAAVARQRMIDSQFSGYDGSHRTLEKIIQKSMNDPDSYKHVETVYRDNGDSILVSTTFRGKNAFGGVVKNTVRARFTIDGRLIEILESGP